MCNDLVILAARINKLTEVQGFRKIIYGLIVSILTKTALPGKTYQSPLSWKII